MSRRRSRVRGVNKLRRTLKRIDPEVTADVKTAIREGAEAIQADAIKLVPKDTGDLARAIDYRVSSDGLAAVVGPAARAAEIVRRKTGSAFKASQVRLSKRNKKLMFEFYKGWWIERGTKGSTKRTIPFYKGWWIGRGTKGSTKRNIPPQPARPFMKPAFDLNESWILGRVKAGINKALDRASKGGGND